MSWVYEPESVLSCPQFISSWTCSRDVWLMRANQANCKNMCHVKAKSEVEGFKAMGEGKKWGVHNYYQCPVRSRPAVPSGHQARVIGRYRWAGHGTGQARALVHGLRQTNVGLHHSQTADLWKVRDWRAIKSNFLTVETWKHVWYVDRKVLNSLTDTVRYTVFKVCKVS